MTMLLSTSVNGEARQDEVEPRTLLIHYLRQVAGLTGSHVGCDTSECGACTVLLDGAAVKSCTVFAVQADGHRVDTVEGLANGDRLHPLQEAFSDAHALQCGYCTPGFLMAALALLDQEPEPDDATVRHALEGNLCRCTGYTNIVEAVKSAAAKCRAGTQKSEESRP